MRTIGMTGQKWLKTVHLLAAILWIGCGIAMNLLRELQLRPTRLKVWRCCRWR